MTNTIAVFVNTSSYSPIAALMTMSINRYDEYVGFFVLLGGRLISVVSQRSLPGRAQDPPKNEGQEYARCGCLLCDLPPSLGSFDVLSS